MNRTNRLALMGAAVLLLVLAGSALATRSPVASDPSPAQADEHEESPDAAAVERAVERLADVGVNADAQLLSDLAAQHGLGGAVRIVWWAADPDAATSMDEIVQRRADGQGWGQIAKELGVHPGIGAVMGNGGGHGRESAPGQQKDADADPDD